MTPTHNRIIIGLVMAACGGVSGCGVVGGVVEPVVEVFTGEPAEPLRPKNAPAEPAVASSPQTTPQTRDQIQFEHTNPPSVTTVSMPSKSVPPSQQTQQGSPSSRQVVTAEAEPGVIIRDAKESARVQREAQGYRGYQGNEFEIFPTSSSAVRRPGMTSGERFDIFGALPSSTAPAAPALRGFDDSENLAQVSFATEGRSFDPAISPDGNTVFFASTIHAPTADIYAKSVAGTAITKLTNSAAHDVMPAVSPSGEHLAFASNRNGSYDIYITNATGGGQAAQVTFDAAHELHPTWSPDGTMIAYCRLGQTSDRWEIWVAEADNPGAQKFLTYGLFPEWHPVDDRILFQRSRDRGDRYFSVWTIRYVDGEALSPTEIAASSVAAVINPSWSSDGSYIAFSTILNPEEVLAGDPQVADLWIARADGTQRANLTGGFFANLMPAWGPEDELFFISDRSGIENIWSIQPRRAIQAASAGSTDESSQLVDVPVPAEGE